jgi:hypothetical protein
MKFQKNAMEENENLQIFNLLFILSRILNEYFLSYEKKRNFKQ